MANSRLCSIPDCGNKHFSKGLCRSHYCRLRRHGDPLSGSTYNGDPERFFLKSLEYEGNNCLIWPYSRGSNGYAAFKRAGKYCDVHRQVCIEANGPPPTLKHEAAHSCGNGNAGCITKRHLSWKTHAENQADRLTHGTHNRGERSGIAKLTEGQAIEIMSLKGKKTQRAIASWFGVAKTTVASIHNGRSWSHLNYSETS